MEASENTLKKYLVQLICSGELQYGINYGEQIINLSNFNANQITDINHILTGIRTELDSTALAEVSRNNLSTLSTGIGGAVTTLYGDRVLGIDLSTLSTNVGLTFETMSLENLTNSVSSLSTVINTNYDEFTSYQASMAVGITTRNLSVYGNLTTTGEIINTGGKITTGEIETIGIKIEDNTRGIYCNGESYIGQKADFDGPIKMKNTVDIYDKVKVHSPGEIDCVTTITGHELYANTHIHATQNIYVGADLNVTSNINCLSLDQRISSLSTAISYSDLYASTLSTTIGATSNLLESFSSITLESLSTLSTGIGLAFSSINVLTSTTEFGLSTLSSQIGLALFTIPSTVSTYNIFTSSINANSAFVSSFIVLCNADIYSTLTVGTSTIIDTNSISSGSVVIDNISVAKTATFSTVTLDYLNANIVSIQTLISPDLQTVASTLSTGIFQTYSSLTNTIQNLQPLSTFAQFTASNFQTTQFTAGLRPHWLLTGTATAGNNGNTVAISYDGFNWSPVQNGNFTQANSATWNGAYWILCGTGDGGSNSSIQKSYDGITWSSAITTLSNVNSATWNGSLWLAAGEGPGGQNMAKSLDGLTWITLTTPFEEAYGSTWVNSTLPWLVYGANTDISNKFYISRVIATYNINDTFTAVNESEAPGRGEQDQLTYIKSMEYTNGKFIAVGNMYYIYTSEYGLNWSLVTNPITGDQLITSMQSIKTYGSTWIIVGGYNSGTNNSYYTKDNGTTFEKKQIDNFDFRDVSPSNIYYNSNNNYWLITGANSPNSRNNLGYSRDGIDWTILQTPLASGRGISWSGQANCNVGNIWGTLRGNSFEAISSVITNTVVTENVNTTNAIIGNLSVGNISITNFSSGLGYIGILSVGSAFLGNLSIGSVYMNNLSAGTGRLENISAGSAFINNLSVGNSFINNVSIGSAYMNNLSAGSFFLGTLSIGTGFIGNLSSSSAFIGTISSSAVFCGSLSSGTAYISTISTGSFNNTGESHTSTMRVDTTCYASTFVGTFAFYIQTV